jgi:hypothetical protein
MRQVELGHANIDEVSPMAREATNDGERWGEYKTLLEHDVADMHLRLGFTAKTMGFIEESLRG